MHASRTAAPLLLVAALAIGVEAVTGAPPAARTTSLSVAAPSRPAATLLGGVAPLEDWFTALSVADRARIDDAERAYLALVWHDIDHEARRLARELRAQARSIARGRIEGGEHRVLNRDERVGPRGDALLTLLERHGDVTRVVSVRRGDSPELAAAVAELEHWLAAGEAMLAGAIAEAISAEGGAR